ncbi:MAG: interleukin-like EMT inducer domain-containing protein, partial [Ardenticatenaceae bacterium]
GFTGLLLLEQLAVPLPLTDATIPAGYEVIADDPDDVAVLTLPLGWRSSFGVMGAENTRNQYYMVGHGKRLVQGNISRAPNEKFTYWEKLPLLGSLIEIQNDRSVPEERKTQDKARALEVMKLLGARYVIVHPAIVGRPPYVDNRERALEYLHEVLPLEPLYTGDDLLVYRVDAPAPESGSLNWGTPESEIYRVAGWGPNEHNGETTFNWAQGEATFLLPLASEERPLTVTLEVRPFQLPQSVQPIVNGRSVGSPLAVESGWHEISFVVPPATLNSPTARVTLRFSRADRPVDVTPGADMIGQTGIATRAEITVKSAGRRLSDLDPEGLAWITVNGAEASAHRFGTNVTVVDPATEEVEAVRGFDTMDNASERDQLHAFIESIPAGKIVIVALRGPATAFLNLDTVAVLKTLGAEAPPGPGPTGRGVSYALIGVKGASEGSAQEAQSSTEAVDLVHAPDERPLSSAVRAVRWQQGEP